MNYFIITDDKNCIEKVMENYRPYKHFNLLDRDLSKEEFFLYVVDIMYEVYAGNNVLITTTNYKGIKKLFDVMKATEIPNYHTMFIIDIDHYNWMSPDDYEILADSKIDNIIIEEKL